MKDREQQQPETDETSDWRISLVPIEEPEIRTIDRALRIQLYDDEANRACKQRPSLRRTLVRDVLAEADAHAHQVGATPDQLKEIGMAGVEVINALQSALTEKSDSWKGETNANFWTHAQDPRQLILENKCPFIRRDSIENATTSYLNLPFRVRSLERLLVDVLIAVELYDYGKEKLTPRSDTLAAIVGQSPAHEESIIRSFMSAGFRTAIVGLGIAAFAVYASNIIGEIASGWIAFIFIGIVSVSFLIDMFRLPTLHRRQKERQEQAWSMFKAMSDAYLAMKSEGAISAKRVRELVTKAADIGVVWPTPLFAILDDSVARRGLL